MVNGFEERLKAVHHTARYAQMKVDDLVEKYIEDIKNLKVIVTRQENTLQAMGLRLARAMRMIHMLTHPCCSTVSSKKFFFLRLVANFLYKRLPLPTTPGYRK